MRYNGKQLATFARAISVIIPVADRPQLLGEAVSSVLSGKLLPGEIVIVVDSIGAGRERDLESAISLKETAASNPDNPRIFIVTCGVGNPATARNLGVSKASKAWLAFLDSDDLWEEGKLLRQAQFHLQRPHLLASHTAERWIKDGNELPVPQPLRPRGGKFLLESFDHCLISPSSILIQRKFFVELGWFDEAFRVCEDYELWLRLLSRHPIGLIDENLTTKRSGGWSQLSRSNHSLDRYRIAALIKLLETTPELPEGVKISARQSISAKSQILRSGAKKRQLGDPLADLASRYPDYFQSQ